MEDNIKWLRLIPRPSRIRADPKDKLSPNSSNISRGSTSIENFFLIFLIVALIYKTK